MIPFTLSEEDLREWKQGLEYGSNEEYIESISKKYQAEKRGW